jgi:hypothetical protein
VFVAFFIDLTGVCDVHKSVVRQGLGSSQGDRVIPQPPSYTAEIAVYITLNLRKLTSAQQFSSPSGPHSGHTTELAATTYD